MPIKPMLARLHAAGTAAAGDGAQALVWKRAGESGPPAPAEAVPAHTESPRPAGAGSPPPGVSREDLEAAIAEANARGQSAAAQSFRDGFSQGRVEGEQTARAELTALLERLARTIADLSGTRDAFRLEAEEDVVRLSLGVARRILHRELSVDPDALLGVIRVALGKFEARELHRILVSPQDHAAIAAALTSLKLPRQVEVIPDPSLERGAALFETVKGTLDSSVDSQLDEIERGFLDVLGKEGRRG